MKENYQKKLILFLTSQGISLFGSSLVQYAIIWFITLKTESGFMMTIATLCAFIPQVIISLFAGVWADKYNKKKLIMLADGGIAFFTLIIAVLFFLNIDYIGLLFCVLAVRSLGSGIQSPTVNAFIPEIVPTDKLMKINGINTTIQSIMLIVSPAVSALLLGEFGLKYIFFVDVITAIIGISIFSKLKYEFEVKENEKVDYFGTIKEGIIYTKNNKLISRLFVYLAISSFLISPLAILTSLLVTRSYGAKEIYLMYNEVVFFIGNILGGAIISFWGGFKNKIHTIGLGCFIGGVFSIMMGVSNNFIFYLITMGLIGIALPLFNTPFITLLQEYVAQDKQGRVFSLVSILGGCTTPLAMVLFGPLSDYIKIEYIILVTGIAFIIGTIFLIKDKVIKESLKSALSN